jgi:AbrB family looped-hinge helix DNA binding protein
MRSTVSAKGRVTIPKDLRDQLGIRPGQILDFAAEHRRLVARKVDMRDPVDAVYGAFGTGQRTDDVIGAVRGPADPA